MKTIFYNSNENPKWENEMTGGTPTIMIRHVWHMSLHEENNHCHLVTPQHKKKKRQTD